ncbi:InlB B-repeat-containing protein [Aliikangiella sp. IMCC44359]|uniref:InlB B-repeat-containing protein n=1 Tax=Aliikangiella sp. IMCC44359 TaxID=3459125 RepID=UPI00403B183A
MLFSHKKKYRFLEMLLILPLLLIAACDQDDPEITVSVKIQGDGKGQVTSEPAGIDCNQSCQADFTKDSGSITLTAVPADDSVFVEWSGDCEGGSTCTVDSSGNHSVTAIFNLKPVSMVNLSVERSGTGSGTVTSAPAGINCGDTCSSEFAELSGSVTLTAVADDNSVFVEWQQDCTGTDTCTVDTDADHKVVAVFNQKPVPTIDIVVTPSGDGSGQVESTPEGIDCGDSCVASFTQNDGTVTLQAEAANGSVFAGWQGDCQGTNECVLDTEQNHSVTATFNLIPVPTVTLSITKTGKGTGSVTSQPEGINCGDTCSATFAENIGNITLTATPDVESIFVEWEGDCRGSSTTCSIETTSDQNATAVFEPKLNLTINDITLINADTDLPINDYDPIASGTTLDLSSLPTKNLNLRVNTSDSVESVHFVIDKNETRIENQIPFSLGDDGNGDYSQWPLTLGEHTLALTPFSQDNAEGQSGTTVNFTITLTEARWSFSEEIIKFVGKTGGSEITSKILTLTNTGNVSLDYQVSGVPDWLTTTPTSGTVVENKTADIEFQPTACTKDGRDDATVTFTSGKLTQEITVSRICSTNASIDFAMDRFYILQSVPSMDTQQKADDQVGLVIGREGLGRAFVTASDTTDLTPDIILNYRLNGGETKSISLSAPSSVPTKTDEAKLNDTFTVELAENFFAAGLEIFIEIDPDNQIPELDETNNRFPEAGYYSPNMITVDTFNITFVPITYNGTPAGDMSESNLRRLLEPTWKMHPLTKMDIQVHAPLEVTDLGWNEMLREVNKLRQAEGSSRAYHGIVKTGPGGGVAGIGYVGHVVAVSKPYSGTIAHEFGHNFGLPHAPCGGPANPDPNFPYDNARTGVWGYDLLNKKLKAPTLADLMSYCGPNWISDYNYKKVAKFHSNLSAKQAQQAKQPVAQTVLLIDGTISAETLSIDTVFSLNTVALANEEGPYTLKGFDKTGTELFRQSFKAFALSHESLSHFSVNVPVSSSSLNTLNNIQITQGDKILINRQAVINTKKTNKSQPTRAVSVGQNNMTQITWDTQIHHAVMVRDPINNQILGSSKTGSLLVRPKSNKVEIISSNGLISDSQILTIQK